MQQATLGAGCFWCVEAIFKQLKGVHTVEPGYANGTTENPTYKEVCNGDTGHAEVCRVTFDPEVISFDDILQVFWQTHNPTTLNRQGSDIGTQYRSAIFYHDDAQKEIATAQKNALNQAGLWPDPIVTEVSPLTCYYPAEDYHRDYFALNPDQGYCQVVIKPKIEKFRQAFAAKLKP